MNVAAAEPLITQDCPTCTETGRRGYCAPARCYCGHDTCYAFASFVRLPATPADLGEAPPMIGTCPAGRPVTVDGSCCGEVHP